MPKINQIQTSFIGGEFSPMIYGQVHQDRYKEGLQTCLNYIPTLQGPLVRRPGTKYVNNVKDPTKPPTLVPFVFSQTETFVLEFGNQYIRFYANGGQVITNSNVFGLSGIMGPQGQGVVQFTNIGFNAVRPNEDPKNAFEGITGISIIPPGTTLEIVSPYNQSDVSAIKFTQKNDVIYLAHPSYPTYKLEKFGDYDWRISPLIFQDGPYLPLNSYTTEGDSTRWFLQPSGEGLGTLSVGPNYRIFKAENNGAGEIRLTTNIPHSYETGDKIFVTGVGGTTEANNNSSSIKSSYWVITSVDSTRFDLNGSTFVNLPVASAGLAFPALFQLDQVTPFSTAFSDAGAGFTRNISLVGDDGFAHPGWITGVSSPGQCSWYSSNNLTDTSNCIFWYMGVYNLINGFPAATCFHQDRLVFAGPPGHPQEVDASVTGSYEYFSAFGSDLQVADNNALSFNLLAEQSNQIMWTKSVAQGLLAGSLSTEFIIQPNSQSAALTPTNVSALPSSYYGSANIDAVQSVNSILYVQRSQRKVRELNYFFQVGTFRSTDLTEISEHITIPQITRLAVQKELYPLVWAIRTDGNLISMSYSRDDISLRAGWSRHTLGGQSDSAGTNPIVKSMAAIPAITNSTSFDQLWFVVQRSTVSGSTFTSIEYMTKPFDDSVLQEDAYQGDCGITFDNPVAITGVTSASSAVVTAPLHGFANNDQIRIVSVVGLNSSAIDINGNKTIFNLVNEKTFVVGSSVTNSFNLLDFSGNAINSQTYGAYVSGGQVRKMVETISGLTWLVGETVGILADGSNHPDCLVVGSGTITLNYRAAKVQIGYRYNSDGASLRQEGGSAQGTSIGETRRVTRVAPQFHNIGDFQMGATFTDLQTVEFQRADVQEADQATPLYSGLHRDSIGAPADFEGTVCWRQSSMLPGALQSITYFFEVQDV